MLFIPVFKKVYRLCQKLVGHRAHDVDGLLLGLDDVSRLGVLGQTLERADLLACAQHRNMNVERAPYPPSPSTLARAQLASVALRSNRAVGYTCMNTPAR